MQAPEQHPTRESLIIFLAVFALAFALRAILAGQWQVLPYGDAPLLDARAYDDWAQAIASGHWLRARAFYQSPLYPYLLAALYKIFGHSYLAASLMNAALDAGTTGILSLISFSLFGRVAAIITGLLAAFYAPMIFYTAPVMKEPLALFLMALFLLTSLRALNAGKLRDYALSGLFLGLAALARGNVLLLAPVLPVAAFMKARRLATKPALWFFAALLIAIAPATLHNFLASRDFVPITYSGGFNLYIGHSAYANGTNAYPPEVSTDPVQEELNAAWIADEAAGHPLKPSQVSNFWGAKAIGFAADHPLIETGLMGLKVLAFLNGAENFDNYDANFIRKNFPTLLDWPLVGFAPLLALAAFGLVAGWRRYPASVPYIAACACVYMLSVLPFYVTDRYRLPVVVFLLPLAGVIYPSAVQARAEGKKHFLKADIAALAFFGLALLPVNLSDFTAFDWGTLVAVYADKGDGTDALKAFDNGIAASATGVGAQAYIRAADMRERLGQGAEAAGLIAKAAALFPQDGVAQYNLGRLQAMQGDFTGAIRSLQRARQLAPTYGLTYYALAKIYQRMGNARAAQGAIEEGLKADPDEERLRGMREE